jgi:hypothetical protein
VTAEQRVLKALSSGDYRTTFHADERMEERCVADKDIRACARSGSLTTQPDCKFKVVGNDLDGEVLTIICVWNGDALIITVF